MQIAELQAFSTSDSSMTANKDQVLANSSHAKYLSTVLQLFLHLEQEAVTSRQVLVNRAVCLICL